MNENDKDDRAAVVVTGISGDLGLRLLPLLSNYRVIGVDLHQPDTQLPMQFIQMDLGREESCRELYLLLREARVVAVIHLAFVVDPVRAGILDLDRMWQINVAGTARVMEAITETNRNETIVQKFIFLSSASAYGSDLTEPASEDFPLGGHSLPYALHKMEADKVVQLRAPSLRGCSAYMLRPHIFAGASMKNYFIGVFRGTPNGNGQWARKLEQQGKRLPCVLPYGQKYLEHRLQFVHVDDVARLIVHIILRTEPESQRLTLLNVAGREDAVTVARCVEVANAKLHRVPGKWALRLILMFMWKSGISAIPPEALPYMTGQFLVNTARLQTFLGAAYEDVIRFTVADAFADCFQPSPTSTPQTETDRQ